MELLDEESHRLLLWLVRLDEVDHSPTAAELARLAEPRDAAGGELAARVAGAPRVHTEGALASLVRRGLVERHGGDRLAPTQLGRRAVDALGLHVSVPAFEVIDADLRSADPLVFARIVGRVAALDAPMVVDPYCRPSELEYLVAHTGVTRVLLSDRVPRSELEGLAAVVRSVSRRERSLKVRVARAEELSDRCVVTADRVVYVGDVPPVAGAPGATVLVEPVDMAPAARDHYRRIWRRAERLAAYRPRRRTLRVA